MCGLHRIRMSCNWSNVSESWWWWWCARFWNQLLNNTTFSVSPWIASNTVELTVQRNYKLQPKRPSSVTVGPTTPVAQRGGITAPVPVDVRIYIYTMVSGASDGYQIQEKSSGRVLNDLKTIYISLCTFPKNSRPHRMSWRCAKSKRYKRIWSVWSAIWRTWRRTVATTIGQTSRKRSKQYNRCSNSCSCNMPRYVCMF